MSVITLGTTGITVPKNGFGALPVQRVPKQEAVQLLRRAYEGGIRFFDTARAYSDSEEKLGEAFHDIRGSVILATKTMAKTPQAFRNDLNTSLRLLQTDTIDLYQFHNPPFVPRPGDGSGLYEAMLEAKAQGKIRHIGITNHQLKLAHEAIDSGLYETLQFPFCYLATDGEVELVNACKKANVGFIAMKSLSGGLITNSAAAYAFAAQFDNVLPIWGIQRESELDEFLHYQQEPPAMTDEINALIEADRKQLSGSFCRGCGYCMPCPMGIQISTCARMSLLLRRAPTASYLGERGRRLMAEAKQCIGCNACRKKCPYGLDTPVLLARNVKDYEEVLAGKEITPDNF